MEEEEWEEEEEEEEEEEKEEEEEEEEEATAEQSKARRAYGPKPGERVKAGVTTPIFIGLPTSDHLKLYNTICSRLKRREQLDDNEAWAAEIANDFSVRTANTSHNDCALTVF